MSLETHTRTQVTPQAILGVLIIAFGLMLTGDNLGWFDAGHALSIFWPLAIAVIGVAKLVQADNRSGRLFGGLLVLLGVWLTADQVLDVSLSIWRWWPVLLVILGVLLVTRAGRTVEPSSVAIDQVASEFAFWSGIKRRIVSPVFKRADLTAIMGGIEIDMRQSLVVAGAEPSVIDVFVMWGGIELRVPPDWNVSNQIVAIMGGAEDKSTGMQDARHRLIIRGFVIMGGVEIKT